MNKSLVCYFSATGTTKNVAEKIKEVLNCDLFEIEPIKKYTTNDLDWTNKESRSSLEMSNDIKPGIKNNVNIKDYNNIIIGFPVWWYKEPTIIDEFIEKNNLESKNIYIFITSGGSSVSGSLENLKNKYNNLNFISGKRFDVNIIKEEILNWIK